MTRHAISHSTGPERSGRRRLVLWGGLALLAVLLFVAAWVGIRGFLAKNELEAAIPLASTIQRQVIDGDTDAATVTLQKLTDHAAAAAQLTSDPVWRAAEIVPWAGYNLTVVRELADIVNVITVEGITPLTTLAGAIDLNSFAPVDNSVQIEPLREVAPQIGASAAALASAQQRVQALDSSSVLGVVGSAVDRLEAAVVEATAAVTSVERAIAILPELLGQNGARNYLLLVQNPAELRAGGGIPGAMALIHTDNGRIDLAAQASSSDFPHFEAPVAELPLETRGLYGDITGEYIQNVTLTPQFEISAPLAREMWRLQFGTEVDGVIAVDPVTLAYLLEATGPVELPGGEQLTAENAVQTLLSEVYARFPDSRDQDAYFAAAASSVFSQVLGGGANPQSMIEALGRAGEEGRVLLWSADDETQGRLAETTLAGRLPTSDSANQTFGVYFNDATGAKMDFYLEREILLTHAVCRNDGLVTATVEVTLTNSAPADAATSLPDYVTGAGWFGVTPGNIRTIVLVYGPPTALNQGADADGGGGAQTTMDSGYPVSAVTVELQPGETSTVRYTMLLDANQDADVTVRHTPGINKVVTQRGTQTC